MGKYQIEYACGHTVTKELFGKIKDREHYIQWASTQECPECKQAKYNKKCQEMAEENNLPALSGSDKQVVWAVAIRQTFLTNLQSLIDERMKKLEEEAIADQAEVLKFLTRIMRDEEKEEVLVNIGNFEQEIQTMKVSAKDRIKAAELLGKRYGSWTDKVDLSSDLTLIFEDDYGD